MIPSLFDQPDLDDVDVDVPADDDGEDRVLTTLVDALEQSMADARHAAAVDRARRLAAARNGGLTPAECDATTWDGPVYVEGLSPEWFDCVDSAVDAAWDDGRDGDTLWAYPCDEARVRTPCLAEIIEEAWAENFDDPDAHDITLPADVALAVADAQALAEAHAPKAWTPRGRAWRFRLPTKQEAGQ